LCQPESDSANVVLLADHKVNSGRAVSRAADKHRPVLVTREDLGVAIVQSLVDYKTAEEERAFMRAVVAGLTRSWSLARR